MDSMPVFPTSPDDSEPVPAHPAAHGLGASWRRERWRIWQAQIDAGHEPCFATDRRFACAETGCPWRPRCVGLRAEWMR